MATPTTAELQALTDTDLENLRLAVVQEKIRRDELTALPQSIDAMTQRFVDHGGDKTILKNPNAYTRGPKL